MYEFKTNNYSSLLVAKCAFVFGHVDIHEKATKVPNYIDINLTDKNKHASR